MKTLDRNAGVHSVLRRPEASYDVPKFLRDMRPKMPLSCECGDPEPAINAIDPPGVGRCRLHFFTTAGQ